MFVTPRAARMSGLSVCVIFVDYLNSRRSQAQSKGGQGMYTLRPGLFGVMYHKTHVDGTHKNISFVQSVVEAIRVPLNRRPDSANSLKLYS